MRSPAERNARRHFCQRAGSLISLPLELGAAESCSAPPESGTLRLLVASQLALYPALDALGLQRVRAVAIEALECAWASAARWK